MEATWLWAIPALPLGGAAVNGVIALARRWTPGNVHGAHHDEAPAPAAPKPPEPAAGPASGATRIRLPGEKKRSEPPPPPTHVPAKRAADHGHGPDLAYAGYIATGVMLLAFAVSVY